MLTRPNTMRWTGLLVANALGWCMLSFYQRTEAAPAAPEPFANAVQQRMDMIEQLKQISAELKAQNALLRSGGLKVVVTEVKPQAPDKKR